MKANLGRKLSNLAAALSVVATAFAVGSGGAPPVAASTGGCQLNSAHGQIQHVINIQFDNTHFNRDNPNVPSDLEQMPNLLNFIESNGTLLTNHHTPLISHTATDILTSFTGVYGDNMGVPVSNSFRYFNPDGTTIPYTRAGCNVGQVATANTVLENIATDIPTVFGAGSPQAAEVASNPGQAFADFVGIGVHCGQGSSLCSTANGGEPDNLPDEPGGYTGYTGLFGHKYVAPQISPSGPMTDLDGNVIQDPQHRIGFPGFDGMAAKVSLSYVASMQEHGIPITYAYISDAHDNHPTGPAYGPGQAGYVAALKAYDTAFGKFFTRLANDGINKSNTLFVFTADEGDHFVGGAPSPAGCDGVNTPCTYSQIGEINANLAGLLATERGNTTAFKVHSDDAPTVYITGNPARDAAVTRTLAHDMSALTAVNPITGNTDTIAQFFADPVEMRILHMVTADPARTPTFTLFADPNYFLFAAAPNCNSPCVTEVPGFAWNHGDVQSDIVTTWLGMVGPGVTNLGIDNTTWSDHTDIRPTLMVLLGLKDDYSHDGRALTEDLDGWARPEATRLNGGYARLAVIYKQIDAAVGQFGLVTLMVSTDGINGNDSLYAQKESQLSSLNSQRDALAAQMIALLEGAEFNGQAITQQQAKALVAQGQALLGQANALLS
ncbi:MAG: hypothetical protein E6J30_02390 [Chloroflexi bacterium]|nr:MAG: hypothetical protein E6J30_02390 [Chloroflexota bacterium]